MEILFRGKRVDNGEWVYGYLLEQEYIYSEIDKCDKMKRFIAFSDYDSQRGYGKRINLQFKIIEVIPETVGMHSSKSDKNGVKIFVGDILKQDGYWSLAVEYENGCVMVRDLDEVRRVNLCLNVPICNFKDDSYVVVGNIHEKEVE